MTDIPEDVLDQAVAFAEMWGTEQNWPHVRDGYAAAIMRDRAAQAERMAKLEEALKPFASYLDQAAFDLDNNGEPLPDDQGMGWVYLTVGDFRRARALSQEGSDA